MLGSIPTYQFLQWVEVSGRLEAGARVFSSSGWRFSDCGSLGSGQIPPVSGQSGTLRGALAGELSQRVEDSVRGEVLTRTDSSSEWAIWDVATRRFGVWKKLLYSSQVAFRR